MARSATLKPTRIKSRQAQGLHSWCLNIPPELNPEGKRQRKFFATRADADAECEKLRARRDNFGTSLTGMTAARIAEAAEAFKLLDRAQINLLDAVRSHLAMVRTRTASVTLRAAFERFAELKQGKSPKYRQEIRQACATFEPLADRMICDVAPADLEPILDRLPAAARNAKMRRLRSVFNLAIKRGWMNPLSSPIARLDFADGTSKEVETYTVQEARAMFQSALGSDAALIPFLTLGFFCGIRPDGELQKLEWNDVKLDGPNPQVVIRPEISKTHRRRFVDLAPNAIAWIEAYRQSGGELNGKIVPFSASTLRRKRRQNRKNAKVSRWIQQGMRHTYCSNWLAIHKDVNQLVLQSGHDSVETMWRRYHRGVTEAEAQAFWSIRPPSEPGNVVSFQKSA